MAKSTNYRGIHISVIYEYGYDYYEIREINKGKKWNDATLFSTLKEAKQYIDDHYDELVKLCNVKESKSYARKSLKEAKNGYYIYTKPYNKYAYCDKSKFTEEGFYLIEDYMLDAIHIFETEKEAQEFIDKHAKRFMVDKDNIIIAEYPSTKHEFFESKTYARKSLKEDLEVKGFYFFNLDVGERCEINFMNKSTLECIILQYYKDERNIYLIVAPKIEKECFIIGYNYNKNNVFYSEKFSSYKNARIAFVDIMKEIV